MEAWSELEAWRSEALAVDLDLVDLDDCFISSVIVSSNSSGIWMIGLDLRSLYDLTVTGV